MYHADKTVLSNAVEHTACTAFLGYCTNAMEHAACTALLGYWAISMGGHQCSGAPGMHCSAGTLHHQQGRAPAILEIWQLHQCTAWLQNEFIRHWQKMSSKVASVKCSHQTSWREKIEFSGEMTEICHENLHPLLIYYLFLGGFCSSYIALPSSGKEAWYIFWKGLFKRNKSEHKTERTLGCTWIAYLKKSNLNVL